MVEELVIEESRHEAVEEMYFWSAVRDRVPNGDELADTATGQEQKGKEILNHAAVTGGSQGDRARGGGGRPAPGRGHPAVTEPGTSEGRPGTGTCRPAGDPIADRGMEHG